MCHIHFYTQKKEYVSLSKTAFLSVWFPKNNVVCGLYKAIVEEKIKPRVHGIVEDPCPLLNKNNTTGFDTTFGAA